MKTRRTITLLSLIAAVLMLMTSVAQAAGPRAQPVRESLEGSVSGPVAPAPEGRCSEFALLLKYTGSGRISGVGEVTFETTHCSYLLPDHSDVSGRYGEADLVMTTKSGDEIHATYSGRQLDETRYFEVMRVKGGTGEFEDARGVVFEIVTVDLSNFDISIRGWGWMIR